MTAKILTILLTIKRLNFALFKQ